MKLNSMGGVHFREEEPDKKIFSHEFEIRFLGDFSAPNLHYFFGVRGGLSENDFIPMFVNSPTEPNDFERKREGVVSVIQSFNNLSKPALKIIMVTYV